MSTEKSDPPARTGRSMFQSTDTKAIPGRRRSCAGAIKESVGVGLPGPIRPIATSLTSATNWPSRARCPTWPDD